MRNFVQFNRRYISITVILLIFLFLFSTQNLSAQTRTEIGIPDIPGYLTLKCDFHMHTVFSDGLVWPTTRVREAWIEGLDCISITDHVEYKGYPEDLKHDCNRSYELALSEAKKYGILLVRGGEITRKLHFNALFLNDVNPLTNEDDYEAIQAAEKQKGFILWNHPYWKPEEDPDELWNYLPAKIYENGWLKGIEIVNGKYYYPRAHQLALDKNLTMFGNSDEHSLIYQNYDVTKNEHRPVTLVFAKGKSKTEIKDALQNQRTAVYFKKQIIGKAEYLKPIFENSVKIMNPSVGMNNDNTCTIHIHNSSDIDFELIRNGEPDGYECPEKITLYSHKTVQLNSKIITAIKPGMNSFKLNYKVQNLLVAPSEGLPIEIKFDTFAFLNLKLKAVGKRSKKIFRVVHEKTDKNIDLFYTIDGQDPTRGSVPLKEKFQAKDEFIFKIAAFKDNKQIGNVFEKHIFAHKGLGCEIVNEISFSPKYSAGGKFALLDGSAGSMNYKDGNWQGYEQNDLMAIIDLGKVVNVSKIRINFLQIIGSWIFLPGQVKFEVSKNNKEYQLILKEDFDQDHREYGNNLIKKVTANLDDQLVRYIKISARNTGACPEWHSGAGLNAWMFVDEIIIQ